ncbi:MFS transporter [Methylobacterium aerolatum]|uniref:MFS family permease n=1 Tax=Methylobacterium aerolatum TaxID=418708 RepID=A0ABU0I4W3_9HYPH|nr:MFS transporter [Methylobacterium aerolatum]MDQ0449662.1 MFS family permease [Methylobacterium aerolatum]
MPSSNPAAPSGPSAPEPGGGKSGGGNPGGGNPGGGMTGLLFATMFPQAAVSMMSLSPPVMAEAVARTYGIPPETAGAYSGLVYVFVLIGNLVAVGLIQRFGPLRLSFACVVGAAVGLAIFATGGIPGLLIGTMLIGLFYGPLTPASSQAMAHQIGSPAFTLIVSIRQTSVPLGGVLAGLLVPPLIGWHGGRNGWSEACLVLALGSILVAGAFSTASPLVRRERVAGRGLYRRRLLDPLSLILRNPRLLRLAGMSSVFGAMQLVLSTFLVVYLVSAVGHDLVTAGLCLSASQVAGILGRPLWGHVADRTGAPRWVLVVLGLGMALSCLLAAGLFEVGPTWLSLPVAILFGASATGWNGVFLAEIMREVDQAEVGAATAGGLLFTYAGIVVGPPLFGALAHQAGFPAAYLVLSVFALGAVLLVRPKRA